MAERITKNLIKAVLLDLGDTLIVEEAVMVGNRISTDIVGANRICMKTILFQVERSLS